MERDQPGQDNHPLRVALVDDQQLLRATLRLLIDSQPDLQVVGEGANGAQAITLLGHEQPDVLLLDIHMAGMDGLTALRLIRQNPAFDGVRVIILTMYELDVYVRQALALGADGYLLKDAKPDTILSAIRQAQSREPQLSPAIIRTLIDQFIANVSGGGEPADRRGGVEGTASPQPPSAPDWVNTLTGREREVLRLVAQGRSNDEIMTELVISKGTIKSHIASLRRKMQARDRVQLALLARKYGLADQFGYSDHKDDH